jgi:Mycothiol maleylpyruvate isomerase N-terminal domain
MIQVVSESSALTPRKANPLTSGHPGRDCRHLQGVLAPQAADDGLGSARSRGRIGVSETGRVSDLPDVVTLFLDGAHAVAEAIADPAVANGWDRPSVLEDQLVSGLAGHLARGGVWVVGDYLDAGTPPGPLDFASAGEYFATLVSAASPENHRAIRERGAAVGAVGHRELVRILSERLEALGPRLRALGDDHRIAVAAGKVMRVEDYLVTRIVEQEVHLDDLARSVDHEPWPMPAGALALTISVGVEIARLRNGATVVIRALYRQGFAEPILPVL